MSKDFLIEDGLQSLLKDKLLHLKRVLSSEAQDSQKHQEVEPLIKDLHPSEIAYIIQYLEVPLREDFIKLLKPFDPEIFLALDDNVRRDVIALLSPKEIAAILSVIESDDALAVLASLDEDLQEQVLVQMPVEQKKSMAQRLRYPEKSAGRLMQKEVICFSQHWTVQQGLEYIARAENLPTDFHDVFIVDEAGRPLGSVPASTLIKSAKNLVMSEIMVTPIRTISAYSDQEEVSFTFRLYDLMTAAVVNHKGELVGMITVDDVMDVIERKATEDILHMGHVHASDFYDSALRSSLSRIHWLVVTLLNALLTSLVINIFQETLKEKVLLTVLMPVAAAMGGSTGIQSTTIIIRALATRELSSLNMVRTFFKEVRVALLNGIIFALLLGGIVIVWFQDVSFAFILGGAVLFNMLWAGISGTFFPIMIARLGHDPALSAGPLVTTSTDVLGYVIFLGLAKLIIS
jgi:magnesium transporter